MPFRRILVYVSAPDALEPVVRAGAELARGLGAALALVYIIDTSLADVASVEGGMTPAEVIENLKAEGQRLLVDAVTTVAPDITPELLLLEEGVPQHAIAQVAADWKADLIVLPGWHRSGIERLFFGDPTDDLVHADRYPVLVVPVHPET